MSYVIYNTETTVILYNRKTRKEYYTTERAAKAALTRFQSDADNSGKEFDRSLYSISDSVNFRNTIEKTHVVKNMMTGEDVVESVNTPYSCSVSSDCYWQS